MDNRQCTSDYQHQQPPSPTLMSRWQEQQEMMVLEQEKAQLLRMLSTINTALVPQGNSANDHHSGALFPADGQAQLPGMSFTLPQNQHPSFSEHTGNSIQQQQQQQHLQRDNSQMLAQNNILLQREDLKSSMASFGQGIDHLRSNPNQIGATSFSSSLPGGSNNTGLRVEESMMNPAPSDTSNTDSASAAPSYTLHQAGRWQQRFEELLAFKREYGHCCVPSHWPQNTALAQWVKRQRSQYKLKAEGKHSNMTDDRQQNLQQLGFVWDSHTIFWEERWNELMEFVLKFGHANVPTKYPPNQQLAIWCKCQRRQYKLFTVGDPKSNMTPERIEKLEKLGFDFFPRKQKTSS